MISLSFTSDLGVTYIVLIDHISEHNADLRYITRFEPGRRRGTFVTLNTLPYYIQTEIRDLLNNPIL